MEVRLYEVHVVTLLTIIVFFYRLYKMVACANPSLKRKSFDDGDGSLHAGGSKKKKPLTNERREERNMREKERSLKITQQIHELRNLLSSGGIIVPKVSVFEISTTIFVTFWLRLINLN